MAFRPSFAQTLILITLAAVFLQLGLWQLDRKAEKEALFERFDEAPSMDLARALDSGSSFARVTAAGRYDSGRNILLDNKVWKGRAGVHVLTPFVLQDGRTILVNRGWLPLSADRSHLPEVPEPGGEGELRGRLSPPPGVGRRLGDPDVLVSDRWPQLVTYLDVQTVDAALGNRLEPWVVLLDASDPNGFEGRQWSPAAMTPEVHGGYALQWLALMLAAIVIWVILGFRRGDQLVGSGAATKTREHSGGTVR